jgi:hypothetical protein
VTDVQFPLFLRYIQNKRSKRLYFHFKAEHIHPLSVIGSQVKRRAMAPKKSPKKNEEPHEGDIISDTTPHTIHSIKSWTGITELLEDELKYADPDSENHLGTLLSLSFIRSLRVRGWWHILRWSAGLWIR